MKWYDVMAMAAAAGSFAAMAAADLPALLSGGAAVGIYIGLSMLLKPKEKIGDVDLQLIPDGEKLKEEFANAQDDLNHLSKCASQCDSPQIQAGIKALVKTGRGIIRYLEQNVGQVPKARRFLNYYLDTAVEITDKYLKMQKRDLPGASLSKVTSQTLEALTYLKKAFDSQYEHLMDGEVMDMESDVEVLKQIMDMDDIK